jgi:hypothetical protein
MCVCVCVCVHVRALGLCTSNWPLVTISVPGAKNSHQKVGQASLLWSGFCPLAAGAWGAGGGAVVTKMHTCGSSLVIFLALDFVFVLTLEHGPA